MDIFDQILGAAPTDPEKMKATAALLRRQAGMGQLGMLTGDKAIAPLGQGLMKGADQYAGQLQQTRQSDEQAKGLSEWRKVQEGLQNRQLDISQQNNQLDYMSAMEAAAARRDLQDEKKQDKQDATDDKMTEKLAGKFTTAKMGQVDASIGELNNMLHEYEGGKELPGMGYWKNLPGANFVLSDKGKLVKSKVQAVGNDLLAMYSGLAVTLPEAERRGLEQMTSGYFSEGDFKRAWPQIVNRYNSVRKGVLGGYDPRVQQKFWDNQGTGVNSDPLDPAFGETKFRGQPAAGGRTAPADAGGPAKSGKIIDVDDQGNIL